VLSAAGRDLKVGADRESERVILEALQTSSSYPVLAEETGEHGVIDTEAGFWIVDPLDGTLNFGRGLPLFSVSIGLWQGGEPILGVVYDVRHDELFCGVVGDGAWCNAEAIVVSEVSAPEKAILATGFPVNRDFNSVPLRRFLDQVQAFKKVRLLGSAALSLAYLACGRVDAYSEEGIMLWDVAAGLALVRAAGGWISVEDSARHKWARNVTCGANRAVTGRVGGR
jgi:myo-inositol-1(or 4)-monophosphatase